jgi:hypothetical protein
MSRETNVFEHPSYGMVQFSHRQGNPKLFGSALEYHNNYVSLIVKTAKLRREDTGDYVDGPMHGDIVEVNLSAAQFAELLTTMNVGLGVPCTIRSREGKMVPPPPDVETQTENLRNEFRKRTRDFARKILSDTGEVKEILKKDKLSKADRSAVAGILDRVAQELSDSAPFFLEMYEEATEKITTSAKAEMEAWAVVAIRNAGMKALAAGQVDLAPPQLESTSIDVLED